MPVAKVRGANINYEVLGDRGPFVALSPGGRRDLAGVRYLAEPIARAGFRVLLHDRRNCGASDVVLEGDEAEYEIWADDLAELLRQLGAAPAFVGGTSSGCRLALMVYLRHPLVVRGLLLWRVTGGAFAAQRLAQNYYGQYVEAAEKGGMAAVCETDHFRERILANAGNRDRILAMDPRRFIAAFRRWEKGFLESASLPVIGVSEEDLRRVTAPACIIPGNDRTHPRSVGETAARLMPNSELHVLLEEDHPDLDVGPAGELEALAERHAALYIDFMKRHAAVGAAP
jgi:pimeloyl-ACP methyl ester carboxylesterase